MNSYPWIRKKIKTQNDAKRFFRFLWQDMNLIFHPDDSFRNFDNLSDEEADLLDQRMDECFELFGDEIYDVVLGEGCKFGVYSEDDEKHCI